MSQIEEIRCPCGGPALPNDHLCGRCRYIKDVFNPSDSQFESKRDRALRAIEAKRGMKGISTITVVE